MKKYIIFILGLLFTVNLIAKNSYPIIPYPNKLVKKDGQFEFKSILTVSLPKEFRSELSLLTETFSNDYCIEVVPSKTGGLEFKHNDKLPDEAYTLSISDNKIFAEASSTTGCFWAIQTLRQLMTLTGSGSYIIANCDI